MILVAAMLTLSAVVPVASVGSQTWYLLGEDNKYPGTPADGTKHLIDVNMSKTENATKTYKDIPADKTAWWYAENAAQCDLTFRRGSCISTMKK